MKRRDRSRPPRVCGGTAWRSSDGTLPHLAAVLVAAGAVVSCGSGESDSDRTATEIEDPEVGETEDLLSLIGPNQLVTPSAASPQGNETSATFINGGAGTIFVSYNSDPGLPWPDTTETHCGWSRSTNGGTTWASTDDHSTPLPGYGAGSGGVPYRYCLGDTFVAPPGPASQVAMTAVTWNGTAQNPKQTRDVALWVSTNGGVTFPNVARVSTAAGSDGQTDGPKMAADPTNHTVWVSWYNGNGSNGSVFLRPMTVGSGGSITAGATVNLTNKLGVPAPVQAHIAVRPAVFQGWLRPFTSRTPTLECSSTRDATIPASG